MFASLPSNERQAFFTLLDEYFSTRPHLLPQQQEGQAEPPLGASTSQKANAPPPPVPAARKPASHAASSMPSGLTSGKSIRGLSTQSKGAALGSMLSRRQDSKGPTTPAEALASSPSPPSSSSSPSLPPPTRRATGVPTTSYQSHPHDPHPQQRQSNQGLGQAKALYDYQASEVEDLQVSQGETITLIEKVSDDWWKAKSNDESEREGIVPTSYLEILQ